MTVTLLRLQNARWETDSRPLLDYEPNAIQAAESQFGSEWQGFRFPLWYPALVFTLAGVGVLRLGRRFTLRSAIIATTVVAGVLGMAVGM